MSESQEAPKRMDGGSVPDQEHMTPVEAMTVLVAQLPRITRSWGAFVAFAFLTTWSAISAMREQTEPAVIYGISGLVAFVNLLVFVARLLKVS
jgi:hypothetical protein